MEGSLMGRQVLGRQVLGNPESLMIREALKEGEGS
jgi:hypothetical protein